MKKVVNEKTHESFGTFYRMRRMKDGKRYGISIAVANIEPRHVVAWKLRDARRALRAAMS